MDALQDEIESLEAILMDDVRITRNAVSGVPEIIETTVFPQLDEESDQQYICLTLQVKPTPGYPETASPEFKLIRPRGLDDSHLETIRAACNAKIKDTLGFPVVFDLIEVVRELLTNTGNLPSGFCVICLYGFTEGDEFSRTECFHYLHSHCLARHLNALRRNYHEEYNKLPAWLQKTADPFQARCPVCREPIADEFDSLKCAMPPAELQNAPDFELTQELRDLQQRMSALYMEQKSRGAIIDVEAETAAVISIETEEELRRRLQRKQEAEAAAAAAIAIKAPLMHRVGTTNGNTIATNTNVVTFNSKTITDEKKEIEKEKEKEKEKIETRVEAAAAGTATDDQHEQHNRRHYRGGRRHQHHHHFHHNRERERERFEQNHVPHHASVNNSQASVSGASKETIANAGGKHAKSNSHAR